MSRGLIRAVATAIWVAGLVEATPALAVPEADAGIEAQSHEQADAAPAAAEAPAQESPPPEPTGEEVGPGKPANPVWLPPEPVEGKESWDWLRTTSGEWLKGKLTRMRDHAYAFDSDEFDDVEVDEEDVAFFRFSHPHTYRFRGREIVRGYGELRDGVVKVRTLEGEIVERDARLLVSISRGAIGELERWTIDLAVGATLREGNTHQTDISGRAEIQRETGLNRFRTNYTGAWSRVDGNKTANNHRVASALDFFITGDFYAIVPFFEFFTDQFQNIAQRYTPGIGLGYQIIDRPRVDWEVNSGIAYQRTSFESGAAAGNDAAVIFQTSLDLEVTKNLDFDNSYALQLVPTDLGRTNHHLESVLSFDLWGPIDFDLSFVWDRIEDPEPQADGSTPKRDDVRMTVGLAIDF